MKPESTQNTLLPKQLPSGVATLPHLGVIRVAGADAASFLQGQLTNDVVLLGMNEARLAAFCSAKGRMQASFIAFKHAPVDPAQSAPDILLICSRDILASTLKRLSMFVMRAKAKLTDASAEFNIYGLTGIANNKNNNINDNDDNDNNDNNAINSIANYSTNTSASALFLSNLGNSISISLYPALGQNRSLLITPESETAPAGEALPTELWNWGEVHAGIATITAPIVEAFVPQMLNYESVGGVNFKKGCYPGQEVVARSQFRGTLKRRAYVVQIDAANDKESQPFVGQEVFHESDMEQACGTVVQVAQNPSGGFSAIVSMQVSASAGGKLTLGSASGANITLLPLPYPLLEDI
jgi:tRNA-modifying protein YgfZ